MFVDLPLYERLARERDTARPGDDLGAIVKGMIDAPVSVAFPSPWEVDVFHPGQHISATQRGIRLSIALCEALATGEPPKGVMNFSWYSPKHSSHKEPGMRISSVNDHRSGDLEVQRHIWHAGQTSATATYSAWGQLSRIGLSTIPENVLRLKDPHVKPQMLAEMDFPPVDKAEQPLQWDTKDGKGETVSHNGLLYIAPTLPENGTHRDVVMTDRGASITLFKGLPTRLRIAEILPFALRHIERYPGA